jgi:hypothetical protein
MLGVDPFDSPPTHVHISPKKPTSIYNKFNNNQTTNINTATNNMPPISEDDWDDVFFEV